ncbi:oligosaccharide flippase family protein [Vibrio hannami]|uniref:oligosaccharide flippase family protein n=1 Tax=Vibrio hannami TaxID=2717094 RepID=UPI0024100AA2|nr:oligosaccharide flippase family protein [Vibrio hannami]MDG3088283.1 oligosaccharide flippase family protein [Vibrio hannami]
MTDKAIKVIKASLWITVGSWAIRLLSILSVIVLARNLDKYDFGVIAACFIVQGLFNAISGLGSGKYLIRKSKITDSDINNAWTINFFTRNLMAGLIFVSSDTAAVLLEVAEISFALKVMSLSLVFQSLISPAINLHVKSLNYSKLTLLEILAKLISTSSSIFITIKYQNYFGVIIGEVIHSGIYAIGTQFIVRHRLRFEVNNFNDQWSFTKWILAKGIVSYVKTAADKIMIGKNFSTQDLGLYNFSLDTARLPSSIFIEPIKRVLYPSLSEYIPKPEELISKLNKYIYSINCIYIPIVFGGTYLAQDIISVVFGDKWLESASLFVMFLPMTYLGILVSIYTEVFTLTGRVRLQFYFESITSLVFVLICLFSLDLDLLDFVLIRAMFPYMVLILMMLTLRRFIPLSILNLHLLMIIPAICSSCMILFIDLVGLNIIVSNNFVSLLFNIVIGAVIYGVLLLISTMRCATSHVESKFVLDTFIRPLLRANLRR